MELKQIIKNKFYSEYYANENGVNSRLDENSINYLKFKNSIGKYFY